MLGRLVEVRRFAVKSMQGEMLADAPLAARGIGFGGAKNDAEVVLEAALNGIVQGEVERLGGGFADAQAALKALRAGSGDRRRGDRGGLLGQSALRQQAQKANREARRQAAREVQALFSIFR